MAGRETNLQPLYFDHLSYKAKLSRAVMGIGPIKSLPSSSLSIREHEISKLKFQYDVYI